jgi:hypothetical protein
LHSFTYYDPEIEVRLGQLHIPRKRGEAWTSFTYYDPEIEVRLEQLHILRPRDRSEASTASHATMVSTTIPNLKY